MYHLKVNRLFLIKWLLLGLMPAHNLRAQDSSDEQSSDPSSAESDTPTSQQEREDKRYEAVIELLGIGTGILSNATGFTVGYFLKPNQIAEINFSQSSGNNDSTNRKEDTDDDYVTYEGFIEGHSTAFALRVKHFFSNSFYAIGGVAYRDTDASYHVRPIFPLSLQSVEVATLKERDLGITASIGNAWQWENFTLGCDWVGFHMPIIKFKDDYDRKGILLSGVDSLENDRNKFERQGRQLGVLALKFYLGAAF